MKRFRFFILILCLVVFTSCDDEPDPLTNAQISVELMELFKTESDTVLIVHIDNNHIDIPANVYTKDSEGEIRKYKQVGNTNIRAILSGDLVGIFLATLFIGFVIGLCLRQ